ncbi:hypothetical protein C8F04DRAFT_1387435 [Mycena alexandri]|uniref:Uncharacterized protein n=1 Tax=Mycena alexandri TaxID=1745969 RepID=A0AAD6XJ25_9AGAR|nr:hypothetical protein C8F04DRAFT_1387435 [Mycena alexandri]
MLRPEQLVANPSRNLPANPQLRHITATVAPSVSSSATTTLSESRVRNQLLYRQQFCAVTGSAVASLEACHLLNAVRKRKKESPEDAEKRKRDCEEYLTELGLGGGHPFLLNSIFNELLLKRDIHHPLDKSGSICFCPPSHVIMGLTAAFKRANLRWETGPRILETTGVSYGSNNFNVYVLNPTAFLPCEEPLLVQATPRVWNQYIYDAQTGQLRGEQGPLTLRLYGNVSTIAVILNASVKISHAILAAQNSPSDGWVIPPILHRLDSEIKDFLQELYFLPATSTATTAEGEDGAHTLKSSADPRDESGDEDHHYNMDDGHWDQDEHTVQPQDGNSHYERTHQGALHTDITTGDLEEDDLEEEEDDEQALTLEEMDLGLKKLRDPSVAVADKRDIGALMFVPRPRPFRPSHG